MRSRVLVVGVCLAMLVSLLSACGGSDSSPAPTATPAADDAASTATAPQAGATEPAGTSEPAGTAAQSGSTPAGPTATPRPHQPGELATDHPRLLVRSEDLPRLREWASDDNPMWSQALAPRFDEAIELMDSGAFDTDEGGNDWTQYPTETFALFFAFISLVHPDEAARDDAAQRARTLLMTIMDEAVQGAAEGERYRDPYFSVFNRSRWWGESFGLTVDWIYGYLSAEDKATIRTVFLRWSEEITNATVTGEFDHPIPIGVLNDPELLSNGYATRWAINNYFTAHMRNLGLMAMSFDEADDPGGELTGYLASATGAWLYMVDALMRGESRGGLSPEGFEYAPQAFAYVMQFLLALHTAGQDDPARWGPQVVVENQPFWDEVIPAMLNSNSPRTVEIDDYTGPVYQPAWYGDGQSYLVPDLIGLLGPMGIYDAMIGNDARLNAARWTEINTTPGGADALVYRASGNEGRFESVLHFLLFDPDAPEPTDPRPTIPYRWFAAGIGRVLARTDWSEDAAWFNWSLGWQNIDHQHGDGLAFEFYRAGEWLTKERTGYGYNLAASDSHNTLTLETNGDPVQDVDNWGYPIRERGSQWLYTSNDPPGGQILALSMNDDYVYGLGDATALYNSSYQSADQVTHASRSIIWLAPDVVVTYDRATTQDAGYFKRYWLHLPFDAEVAGNQATMTTANGQQLVVTSLLPDAAEIVVEPAEPIENEPAYFDPIQYRLMIEAPGDPADVRFLTVLQGADAGAGALAVEPLASTAGTAYAGAVVGALAVLFPVTLGEDVQSVSYGVPSGTTTHYITGLTPGGSYSVSQSDAGGTLEITLTAGGDLTADEGGVLVVTP